MRYIGNKTRLLDVIEDFLQKNSLISSDYVFCDAFAGTGSVSAHFKEKYKKVIANDNLYFSYVFTQGKINTKPEEVNFKKLGFDPFDYFNNNFHCNFKTGFFYQNYSEYAGRQYFSDENSMFIDFIRTTIEEWKQDKKITVSEYNYLLASLIDSIAFVANVAGVYGSYLKIWDPRAVKPMTFKKLEHTKTDKPKSDVYNLDILDFISKVEGDVLYLDPPYTKNKYTVQYHLLETLAKYDNKPVHGKCGLRDMSEYSTDLSTPGLAEICLEKIIKDAKFRYIILSYSCDGIISKDFIESLFKRYAVEGTYKFVKVGYRRYKNSKAADNEKHQEYLFFIEKKSQEEVLVSSPLNYIGGKGDMIEFLKSNMPNNIETFYDLFAGGANVCTNIQAEKVIYNDINFIVKNFNEYLKNCDINKTITKIDKNVKRYQLEKKKKEPYIKLREKYNKVPLEKRDYEDLFLLIMYGFQQQIRFNSNYEYNNPVGMANYNDKIKEKLISFVLRLKEKNIEFYSKDYELFEDDIKQDDFVYIDPPYLITLGSYNDGKRGFNGWNEAEEERLLSFLERIHNKGARFMLSNVITHKGKENKLLKDWIKRNNFKVIAYNKKARGKREEVIVVNY